MANLKVIYDNPVKTVLFTWVAGGILIGAINSITGRQSIAEILEIDSNGKRKKSKKKSSTRRRH